MKNSVVNLTPGHVTQDAIRPQLPGEGVLIMDACPVTALGMKRVLTGSCGITKSVNFVQRLAGIPAALASLLPALLIMDICGEKESVLDGLRLLAHLQDSHPEMKIIICTDFSDHRVLDLLASSPVNGLLLKHEPELALMQCVFDVMAGGEQWLSPKAKRVVTPTALKNPALTACELEVLTCLFSGMSVSSAAKMLHRDIRTVSTHKRNAMMKLGFHNDSELFAQGSWMAKIGPAASH